MIPAGPPAWAADGPPPPTSTVRAASCFCAGIPNLMRRVVGRPVPCEGTKYCGGTGAYGRNFSSYPRFDIESASMLPRGTLLGIRYRSVASQGHVAILLGRAGESAANRTVLQSIAMSGPGGPHSTIPGVNELYTLADCNRRFEFCRFEYALPPSAWLLLEGS